MKTQYKIVSIISCLLLAIGCAEAKRAAEVELPSEEPPTEVTEVDGVTNGSPLYLRLEKRWESSVEDAPYNLVDTCFIPPGSPVGTSRTCSMSVPELELFYSQLNFKIGTLEASSCSFIGFAPYYYLRSNKKIINDWDLDETEIDCENKPYSEGCYGGAAPVMLGEDWGKNKAYYFLPAVFNQAEFPLDSSNHIRQLGNRGVNYMVINDVVNPALGQITPDRVGGLPPYVDELEKVTGAGTWQDYTIQCKDIWGAMVYELVLKLSDENTEGSVGGPVDHFPDWPY